MAKPSLFKSLKLKRLMKATGLGVAPAVGHLECLWHCGYEVASAAIGSAEDVELAAEWEGEPGKLARALHEAGFLDLDEHGIYHIHDLFEHAPDYVRKRRQRAEATKNKDLRKETADNDGRRPSTADNGAYPNPSPPNPSLPFRNEHAAHASAETGSAGSADAEIVMTFPTDGTVREWHLRQSKLAEYVESFPSLDVEAEMRKARQWLRDNPTHRKTAAGMPRFLGAWLSKAQNNPKDHGIHRRPGAKNGTVENLTL